MGGLEYLRSRKHLEFLNAGDRIVGESFGNHYIPLICIGSDPLLPLRSFQIFTTHDGKTCFYMDIGKDDFGENVLDGRLNLCSEYVRMFKRDGGQKVNKLFEYIDGVLNN